MKLKNIKGDCQLAGKKIKVTKELQLEKGLPKRNMVIQSGWNRGLWLKEINTKSDRVYPLTFKNFEEIGEIEIQEEKSRCWVLHLMK